jgi:beta-glucanase (GH16 family)
MDIKILRNEKVFVVIVDNNFLVRPICVIIAKGKLIQYQILNIMKQVLVSLLAIIFLLFSGCKKEDPGPTGTIDVPEGYTLVWSDEFDGSGINTANWNYQTGDGTDYGLPSGWGNNELQIYTDNGENAAIQIDEGRSVLAITALKDNSKGYTSARLSTKGNIGMRFGRLEVRAKLPEGQGIWPAIWMLGDNIDQIDWPGCGEVDIVELLGHEPDIFYTTLHYVNGVQEKGESQNTFKLTSGTFSDTYHIFTMDWTPEVMTFMLDGQQVFQVSIEDDMKEFLRSAYLLLNVAVGGYWPGNPDATTVFPQTLYVDYIRIFSKDDMQIPEPPVLVIEEETIGQVIEPNIGDNAIRDDFTDLGSLEVISYGGGGEPLVLDSETAIDGDKSLVFDFPGGAWGGAYILLTDARNLSNYSYLKFSLNYPASLANAEIKLESLSTSASIFLENYSGSPVAQDFLEYTIPLADFSGLDLTQITIPFAIWNPQDASQNFVAATVLIDNVYFSD